MSSLLLLLFLVQCLGLSAVSAAGVQLHEQNNHVVMNNGILQVSISTPQGFVIGIQYKGNKNLLNVQNEEDNRGIEATNYKVIMRTKEQVELSFTRMWQPYTNGTIAPVNIDKRFLMLRGSSGFYSYAIYKRLKGWPGFQLFNNRMVFKPNPDKFHYMIISGNRQREMPLQQDRERGHKLAYEEAVLLPNGEVDDKYQYSMDAKDIRVHGWISTDSTVGFWQILPSSESRSFGPLKQFLTSHTGPISINTFHSTHYVGENFGMKFKDGEAWKKIFGPFLVYVNSVAGKGDRQMLWRDANRQFMSEVKSWPYKFPASKDFARSNKRGSISGRLIVKDSRAGIGAKGAYVGLAKPGKAGSWQTECKGYQFWTVANEGGNFSIKNVLIGNYNLYAWIPGFIGDFKYHAAIRITAGSAKQIGNLVYKAPRNGPTLWEIGIPDRSAAEFYIPNPNPKYINKLYVKHDRFRQYGLWERYAELHRKRDLVYEVWANNYRKDWYFAQNTRKKGNKYEGSTWQIQFKLEGVVKKATYKLRVAVAAAHGAELQVRVNSRSARRPLFSSGSVGRENAIARHGIHGVYKLFNVDVPGKVLRKGNNTIYLSQPRKLDAFTGIMYDYLRFEGPDPNS
ncbi:rhamnogalacturonan endolyase [Citrus sinensis]|uniref:Rhamnogalacturonan endolyase n=1 Tax=Citrus sinensis TaxID=2711 RepID=A0ACB8KNW1_CITSI|nr:rhamnogalacturonan endolyase [Citrus sinensis]